MPDIDDVAVWIGAADVPTLPDVDEMAIELPVITPAVRVIAPFPFVCNVTLVADVMSAPSVIEALLEVVRMEMLPAEMAPSTTTGRMDVTL